MAINPNGVAIEARRRARVYLNGPLRSLQPVVTLLQVGRHASESAPPPKNAFRGRLWYFKGVMEQKLHRSGRAEAAYGRATTLDGRFSGWYARRGDALRHMKRYHDATAAYRQSLDLDDTNRRAHFWLGVLLNQPGENDPAAQIGPWSPDSSLTASELAMVRSGLAVARGADIDDPSFRFWLGVAEEYRGDLASAETLYLEALDKDDSDPVWFRQLARVRRKRGHWRDSVEAYEHAVALLKSEATSQDPDLLALLPPATLQDIANIYDPAAGPIEDRLDPLWMRELRSNRNDLDNWAAVASLHRSAMERHGDTAQRHFWLGVALQRLQDWNEAASAFECAVNMDPSQSTWFDRLAATTARLERWDECARACERAIELEPAGHRYFRLAVAYQRCEHWESSSEAYERAVELDGAITMRIDEMGVARRQTEDWAGAASLYRSAVQTQDDARYRYWLGRCLEELGDWAGAVDAYRSAVEVEPLLANWHYRLGLAHEHSGSESARSDPRVGLVLEASDLEAARSAYQAATKLEPGRAAYWLRLGDLEERVGEFDAAQESFRSAAAVAPDNPQVWYRLGRNIAAVANRRGAYLIDEHDELERVWGKALAIGPGHSGARQQLTRASVKNARWRVASKTAWFPPPPHGSTTVFSALRGYLESEETPDSLREVAATLQQPSHDLRTIPTEWWFPLHWRLLTEGHFTLAYRAKSLMAEQVAAVDFDIPEVNLAGFLEKARALAFLGRFDEALEHLRIEEGTFASSAAIAAAHKMRGDIEMSLGNVDTYTRLLPIHDETNLPEADDIFRELVTGRTVAIIGPASTGLDHGDEIDAFDVVVRTKFVSDRMEGQQQQAGSRTDLSYYALGSAQFLQDDIIDALDRGELRQAIFRTATFSPTARSIHHPGDVRYVPSEYVASFRSGQFAIQRIIYDLLRYRPAAIKLFNINFFVDPNAYRPGYLADYTKDFKSLGLTQVLGAFGHDYLADFLFTQRLYRARLITGDSVVTSLLDLSGSEYLSLLDSRDAAAGTATTDDASQPLSSIDDPATPGRHNC